MVQERNKAEINDETQKNKILYDSLFENERQYLRKILNASILGEQQKKDNVCTGFISWMRAQFLEMTAIQPSPTLIYNLEFLQTKAETHDLLVSTGNEERKTEYAKNIKNGQIENYEDERLDIRALGAATKESLKDGVQFFNEEQLKVIEKIYSEGDENEKRDLAEKLPFLMDNRVVFGLVRSLVELLDKNKERSGVELEKSVKVLADTVFPTISKNSRREVMRDMLECEFNCVPEKFYD